MKIILLTGILIMTAFLLYGTPGFHTCASVKKQETVVLLHGLARSSKAMNKLEKKLTAEGYTVINHDYPSTSATIEKLTADIFQSLEPQICPAARVHFVTHSMGGIILREYLEDHDLPNLGRVVMLAPPSRGSEVTDKLGGVFLYQWINGPAGNQLGTNGHPLRLKAPEFELGIVAGDRSINPILSMLIPGPDDGKVALARVKPAAYTDYLQLHTTHATMMWNRTVIEQTVLFLESGRFTAGQSSCSIEHPPTKQPPGGPA
ncbi:esterase/lipase family protein [Pontiella agarivorans]|uniref:Alpha/beta fold hydrolase n=1 Tax=Pontiella agarivorans TaxID=3038953 RepID=A0ABU5MW28_9BACT|nr:alpha/beta fold hydrolase [Pontiella agarivorans]MDZ8118415.1 alpha/beta fold hydrolase [Pontiella agarivorans]